MSKDHDTLAEAAADDKRPPWEPSIQPPPSRSG